MIKIVQDNYILQVFIEALSSSERNYLSMLNDKTVNNLQAWKHWIKLSNNSFQQRFSAGCCQIIEVE